MYVPRKQLMLLVALIYLVVSSLCFAQRSADENYEAFKLLYRKDNPSESDLEEALNFVKAAFELSPDTYKYAFSLGAVNHSIGRYQEALEWFDRAKPLARTDEEKDMIDDASNDCKSDLAKLKVKKWPKLHISMALKIGSVEMDRSISDKLPKGLPEVNVGKPHLPLVQAMTEKFKNINTIAKDVFLIAGHEDRNQLDRHYERGIKDFYRYIRRQYFATEPKRLIVVFIDPRPYPLVKATKRLYPDIELPVYAPFLGYYNPSDNLIMATGGDSGYGTLYHELIHALMENEFPKAPAWLNEGLASLYERTQWTPTRLNPLPNWRMDQLKEDRVGSLAEMSQWAQNPSLDPHQIAKIRLFLLFLDHKQLVEDLYRLAKEKGADFSVSDSILAFGLTESDWQTFLRETFREYRVEIALAGGQLSNPDEIRFIQRALNQVIDAGLTVDGIWGQTTRNKVKEFQQRFSLKPDGIVGSKTKAKLKRQFTISSL